MPLPTITFCLLGKTGTGKSATGNSLLAKQAFKSGSRTSSITADVSVQTAEVGGRRVTVVDGPGVGDTRLTPEEDLRLSTRSLERVMAVTPGGYDALLLLFRYGTRYTDEDRNVLTALKTLLGADFVRKNAVLVVTCGDILQREISDENEDGYSSSSSSLHFSQWLGDLTGDFADLRRELAGRVVLFDNWSKDARVRDAQRAELFRLVDNLRKSGHRYTPEDFRANASSRKRALVEARRGKVYASTKAKLDIISAELTKITTKSQSSIDDVSSQIRPIENLQSQVQSLRLIVDKEDEGTGAMKSVQDAVDAQRKVLDNALRGVKALVEQKRQQARKEEEMRRKEEERRREHEEMMREAERRRQREAREEAERRREREAEMRRREEEGRQRQRELERKLEEEQRRLRELQRQREEERVCQIL